MTTTQKVTVTALVTLAVGTGVFEAHRAGQMRTRLLQVEGQLPPLTEEANQLRRERDQAAAELKTVRYQLQDNSTELARLRGEVARWRTEAQDFARASTAGRQEPEADGVHLRKENLHRVRFDALNDNFELTETSKDLLQLSPEESARITASLQAFKQRIQAHDLAEVRQVPAEEVKDEDIVRFLKRNSGLPTTFRIPPFSPQEQQALKEWFGQQLDQIVGGERSRLLVMNAKLSLDFWLGGTEDKILAFVDPADAGESPASAWMVKFNTPSSRGTYSGGSRSEPVPPQLRYLFEIHQPPNQ